MQGDVGKRLGFAAAPGRVEQDCRASHQRTAQRMLWRCELESALAQVCSGPRICRAEHRGGAEQRRDRELVAGICGFGELWRHLNRGGARGQQHLYCLALKSALRRCRQCVAHCLAYEVVAEGQSAVHLGEKVQAKQLVDCSEQGRRRRFEHRAQIGECESPPEYRRDASDLTRLGRHTRKAVAHAVANSRREASREQNADTGIDLNETFLQEPEDQLDQEKWVAPSSLGDLQQGGIRFGADDVRDHLRDGCIVELPEAQALCSDRIGEAPDGASELRRRLVGAEREQPDDRKAGQPLGQRAYGREAPVVGPLQIIEADEDGRLERGSLEQGLQVLQKPISLLREHVQITQGASVQERRFALDQCVDQRAHRDEVIIGLDDSGCDAEAGRSRRGSRVLE
ncbi:MAG TPA: hypothetical protein VFD90_03745 [Gaiellales bacterium]|nr:hypothetical protein [Gaiellales bacterium]